VTLRVDRTSRPERTARLVNDLGDRLADISVEDPAMEEVIDRVFTSGADDGVRMIRTYRALFVAQLQSASQYRVQSVLWMLLEVVRPVIFLAAWVAVANAQGGRVGRTTCATSPLITSR